MLPSKIAIFTGALITIAMCTFPPYEGLAVSPRKKIKLPSGYHYFLDAPENDQFNTGHSKLVVTYSLDKNRLLGQLLLVGLFTTTAALVLHPKFRMRD